MSNSKLMKNLSAYFEGQFKEKRMNEPDFLQKIRSEAFASFQKQGFPKSKDEQWRKTKLSAFTSKYFHPGLSGIYNAENVANTCVVPQVDTYNVHILNGHFAGEKLEELPNGIVIGSLNTAIEQKPELVQKYFNKQAEESANPLTQMNTALFIDGIFLYVPENVRDFKLQITYRLDAKVDAVVPSRNLFVLEKNAQVDIIQCDDSNVHRSHFATVVSETFLEENAEMNWYKYQNINNVSALFSHHYFRLSDKAKLYTNFFELNGKLLRNEQSVDINGKDVSVDLFGLYLTDKAQQSDNVIFVSHASEGSYSNQKFKGILDDSAKAFFNGKILVKKEAQQTQAFQKNDNIILTDKARISSQPFLEIYADDVSCSHGSTTGQIDEEALFYIRQRGINKRDAQLLQLYAFTGEIIDSIKIPELIEPTKDLIKKRLNGELDACEECILQCAVK